MRNESPATRNRRIAPSSQAVCNERFIKDGSPSGIAAIPENEYVDTTQREYQRKGTIELTQDMCERYIAIPQLFVVWVRIWHEVYPLIVTSVFVSWEALSA